MTKFEKLHRRPSGGSPCSTSILHPLSVLLSSPRLTHQRSRVAHMRNFSKFCEFIASSRSSPLPLSWTALPSRHPRCSLIHYPSPASVRKSLKTLTQGRVTQYSKVKQRVAHNRPFGATRRNSGATRCNTVMAPLTAYYEQFFSSRPAKILWVPNRNRYNTNGLHLARNGEKRTERNTNLH